MSNVKFLKQLYGSLAIAMNASCEIRSYFLYLTLEHKAYIAFQTPMRRPEIDFRNWSDAMSHVHLIYDLKEMKCVASMACKITTTTPRVLDRRARDQLLKPPGTISATRLRRELLESVSGTSCFASVVKI